MSAHPFICTSHRPLATVRTARGRSISEFGISPRPVLALQGGATANCETRGRFALQLHKLPTSPITGPEDRHSPVVSMRGAPPPAGRPAGRSRPCCTSCHPITNCD